eukprot:Opistho-2@91464
MADRGVVRSSKFRHVFGTPAKKEKCFDGFRITRNAWDSNYCAVNPKFIAVVLEAGGGGAFAVVPGDKEGIRVDANVPKVTGHKGAVLDIAWNPFNDNVIASCSDDCTVKVWVIPDGGLTEELTVASVELIGHDRKVGQVLWHPTAENVLASSAFDFLIKLWNVGTGEVIRTISGHTDTIYTMSWSFDGSLLATSSKDKKLRVFDPHTGAVKQEAVSHDGSKASRAVFLTGNRIFTTGFSKNSERQYGVWNASDLSSPLKIENIDTASGVLFPFYDPDTSVVYVAGKGDGNIRYFEIVEEAPWAHFLTEFKSNAPQRGLGYMPKRGLNVLSCEVARFYKLHASGLCEPIAMTVPRKSDHFQEDLFPLTAAYEPSLSAADFIAGKNAPPKTFSLRDGAQVQAAKAFTSSAPKPSDAPKASATSSGKTVAQLEREIAELKLENQKLREELAKHQ